MGTRRSEDGKLIGSDSSLTKVYMPPDPVCCWGCVARNRQGEILFAESTPKECAAQIGSLVLLWAFVALFFAALFYIYLAIRGDDFDKPLSEL